MKKMLSKISQNSQQNIDIGGFLCKAAGCLRKVFWKISQKSQENIYVGEATDCKLY